MIGRKQLRYSEECKYPVVAKTNIGASGSGVTIINNNTESHKYINDTFSGKGAPQRTGPNLDSGAILKRGIHYLFHPSDIARKLDIYRTKTNNLQKGFVFFQEYIAHDLNGGWFELVIVFLPIRN